MRNASGEEQLGRRGDGCPQAAGRTCELLASRKVLWLIYVCCPTNKNTRKLQQEFWYKKRILKS